MPTAELPDHYEILEVSPRASRDVIEAAYRRLARKYHPDIDKRPGATERMEQVNRAFEVLSDPVSRSLYDAERGHNEQRRESRTNHEDLSPKSPPAHPPEDVARPRLSRLWPAVVALAGMVTVGLLGAFGVISSPSIVPQPLPNQVVPQPQQSPLKWTLSRVSRGDQVDLVIEDGVHSAVVATERGSLDPIERWKVLLTTDLNGDGRPDAIVQNFSGGAHCCFSYLVFISEPGQLMQADAFRLGNSPLGKVQDLDGDGIPELMAGDDRLAFLPELPFASTPILPLVLCRSLSGIYVDCNDRYPQVLNDALERFRQQLSQEQDPDGRRGAAVGIFALADSLKRRLGDDVAKPCPDCVVRLRRISSELSKRLTEVRPEREKPKTPLATPPSQRSTSTGG